MANKNCMCRVCGAKYHYCGSCSPERCMDAGCCSDKCLGTLPLVERLRANDTCCDYCSEAADEIERLRAENERLRELATMMAKAFENWAEPQHDGTREWCPRFNTYLRGHVLALAIFTPEEWQAVRKLIEGE